MLVDDRPAVRRGLRIWLALDPSMEVIGEADDGAEAISLARALCPDVVLMDLEMPGMDGISATAALRSVVPVSNGRGTGPLNRVPPATEALTSQDFGLADLPDAELDTLFTILKKVRLGAGDVAVD